MSFVGPKYLADSAVEPQRGLIDACSARAPYERCACGRQSVVPERRVSCRSTPWVRITARMESVTNGNVPGRSRRVLGADDQRDDLPASGAMTATS